MGNSVPYDWIDYTNVGSRVKKSPFLPFKVPLREQICANLPDKSQKFTPTDLLTTVEQLKCRLSSIIDLTLTTRYYPASFFTDRNIQHAKIRMQGQGKVPPDEIVDEFFSLVDDFLHLHDSDDFVIGVHCTHGVNRTGYLICRYLIERLGVKPKKAVHYFEKARGHPFDHDSYRDDLLSRESGQRKIRTYEINDNLQRLCDGLSNDQRQQQPSDTRFSRNHRSENNNWHDRHQRDQFQQPQNGYEEEQSWGNYSYGGGWGNYYGSGWGSYDQHHDSSYRPYQRHHHRSRRHPY